MLCLGVCFYSKMYSREMSHLMTVARGGCECWQGGREKSCGLWTECKFSCRSVLIRKYFGTSSPASPDIDKETNKQKKKPTKYLPQKTNKETCTTGARNYSLVSFCIPATLALQTLWHTWHYVPPCSLSFLKIIRTILICRRLNRCTNKKSFRFRGQGIDALFYSQKQGKVNAAWWIRASMLM